MHGDKAALGYSEFANNTTVHPVGLTILLLLGLAMLAVPRRYTMFVLFACASFIAGGQRIVVFGFDFGFLRIMVLFAWARILSRGEYRQFRWNRLDYYVIGWCVATLLLYVLSHGAHTIVYKLGTTFDSIGTYFLIRCLVRDLDDVRSLISSIAVVAIIVAYFFLIEYVTKRNMFSVLGGVPEFTPMREGKLRCQGAYPHAILAGCFWAVLVPLLAARALTSGSQRVLAIVGLVAAVLIVVLSNSSTPLVGMMSAIMGFMVYPFRKSMRIVRWSVVGFIALLQSVMISPVYHLIARITFSSGNTGAHRVQIIESAIQYFSEWAICGTDHIDHWNIYNNDVTNKYVVEGISGGIIELSLFLMLFVTAFQNIGRLWRKVSNTPDTVIIAWSLGVSVFVHGMNFLGITYFGQNDMLWIVSLALTAVIPSAAAYRRRPNCTPATAQQTRTSTRSQVATHS